MPEALCCEKRQYVGMLAFTQELPVAYSTTTYYPPPSLANTPAAQRQASTTRGVVGVAWECLGLSTVRRGSMWGCLPSLKSCL